MLDSVAVLIPIKAFSGSKSRLAADFSPEKRTDLIKKMAAGVIAAAEPFSAFVVCDDKEVAQWAQEHRAQPIFCSGPGLNKAAQYGFSELKGQGFEKIIVAHGDLPCAESFEKLLTEHDITIVPDRKKNGTNVICLAVDAETKKSANSGDFRFCYGAGSFQLHKKEAERLGLSLFVLEDPKLSWDIDTPEDIPENFRF